MRRVAVAVLALFALVSVNPHSVLHAASGQYVGSAKSNKYHRQSCRSAYKISPANLVTFSSPEDARSRGYVPCKVCRPAVSSQRSELYSPRSVQLIGLASSWRASLTSLSPESGNYC